MAPVAIMHWEDDTKTVASLSAITEPRKEFANYKEGEYVTAMYSGKEYRAVICEISGGCMHALSVGP